MSEEIKPIKFKNDSDRMKREFDDLNDHNPNLRTLLEDLNHFVNDNFKKELVITMIFRTQEEQDAIYANDEKYKKKKFKSPHQLMHGVDIRSETFSQEEKDKMVEFLNNKGKELSNYYSWTAKVHQVGQGALHFHIQYVKN